VIVKVSVTHTPEGITAGDALFVTAMSADGLAAAAGTDAVRDVARAGAEIRASPLLNTRERRNMADLRSCFMASSFAADRLEVAADVRYWLTVGSGFACQAESGG
jgi:hypothetical protein